VVGGRSLSSASSRSLPAPSTSACSTSYSDSRWAARPPAGRVAGPGRHRLPDQGVRARRLRRWWLTFPQQGFQTTSKLCTESLFRERGIRAITGAHVTGVEAGVVHYEQLDGSISSLFFDFAMLLAAVPRGGPKGVRCRGGGHQRRDFRTQRVHEGGRRLLGQAVRGVAGGGLAEHVSGTRFPNIFAVGIAFAPPLQISQPRKSANGTVIAPSPARAGMP